MRASVPSADTGRRWGATARFIHRNGCDSGACWSSFSTVGRDPEDLGVAPRRRHAQGHRYPSQNGRPSARRRSSFRRSPRRSPVIGRHLAGLARRCKYMGVIAARVERIEQPVPYVDEGTAYDDRDEVQARSS